MGSIAVSHEEVLAQFDQLVKDGIIKYDYSYVTENHKIDGIDFEFRISQALQSKPWTTDSAVHDGPVNLVPRPGSDINTQGSEVTNLLNDHFLAFNGFSSYRPHYLLMTADGYRRQLEPLDIIDFRAVHHFLDTLGKDSLVFYNCKVEGGCSRLHKHMQAIPKESFNGNPWYNIDNNADALPFVYFMKDLDSDLTPEKTYKVYQEGLTAVERWLDSPPMTEETGAPPHNMIMDRHRMMVVPRRAAGVGEVGANSGGMLGMMWTQSHEHVQKWLKAGPAKVLETVGVPKPS